MHKYTLDSSQNIPGYIDPALKQPGSSKFVQ